MQKYAGPGTAAATASEAASSDAAPTVRFMTLDPGHFHAALVQKSMYPQVSPDVDVYASPGFDLDEHLKRIASFNSRSVNPTAWRLRIHDVPNPFERLIADPPGNVVIIAGRNSPKIDYVIGGIEKGLNLLVDKPWIITSNDLSRLDRALDMAAARGIVAYDIMTERFEVTNALQRELVNDAAIFGSVVSGSREEPAVYMKSVHHIVKQAAGAPLRRPTWFFDIGEQGEALADIGTHLVDLSLWTLFPDSLLDYRTDVHVNAARRWPTRLTREQFALVTGAEDFPAALLPWVRDGALDFFANTAVEYDVRGVHVELDVLWHLESKEHGDTHSAIYRGSLARIELRQGAPEGWVPEVYVIPNRPADEEKVLAAVTARVKALQDRCPGLGVDHRPNEIGITVPDRHRLGHEAHFAEVTTRFLSYVGDPASLPEWEAACMMAKYFVTTRGTDLSLADAMDAASPAQ